MRQLLKYLLVLIIMNVFVTVTDAASYSREWKTVESLLEQDLPESAYKEVESILAKAVSNGDCYQMLKSRVYMISIGSEYRQDYVQEAFDGLHSLIPNLKDEYLPLGWALLGNCYSKYYSENRYTIDRREETETIPGNMALWSQTAFSDTIFSCILNSITINVEACRKARAADCQGLIEINKSGDKIMPSLYDALLWNALDSKTYQKTVTVEQAAIFKDERLYSMDTFLEIAGEYGAKGLLTRDLHILEHFVRNYIDDSDKDCRNIAMICFFKAIDNMRWRNEEKFVLSLKEQGESLLSESPVSAELIAWYAQRADTKNVAATVALCRKAEQKWPGSPGAVQCHNWILEQERPYIAEIMGTGGLSSTNPLLFGITFRNISKIWFKAVKSNEVDAYGRKAVSRLNQLPAEQSWTLSVDDPKDYSNHSVLFSVPELTPGGHYILASDKPEFDEESAVSYIYVDLCSFMFVSCGSSSYYSGGLPGFVADRVSGKPLAGCSYKLFRTDGYGRNGKDVLVAQGVTASDGLVNPDSQNYALDKSLNRYKLELSRNGESTTVDFTTYYNDAEEAVHMGNAHIYPDRYTYRPGETVQFNCIVYRTNGYSQGQTLKDCKLLLTLRDANYQMVDTLSLATDIFGTAAGSFRIPHNLLPGRYTIEAAVGEDSGHAYITINVEEFRQPTFQTEMEGIAGSLTMGDTAVVKGSATTYTGVPVGGAKVSYTVNCEFFYRTMWRNDRIQILSDETVTAPDGTFTIKFPAQAGKALEYEPESLNFIIEAQVTDLNGETHTAVTRIHTGRDVKYARITGASVFTSAPQLQINVTDGSWNNIAGKVNVVIERLAVPEKPLLDITGPFTERMRSGNLHITPEIREKFPMYDFDAVGKDEWLADSMAYCQTIGVPEGAGYILQLPQALPTGTYRVRAQVDGIPESCDTLFITSVIQNEERMPDNSLLLAIPVQDSCKVGETAGILVGSAFPEALVYYVVEDRTGLVDKGIIAPEGKVTRLNIPVVESMKGGFKVRFGTIYQRVCANASCDIEVPFYDKELDISLVTFRDMLEPDKTETWELCIKDYEGKPVDASLMLAMYDSALDTYGYNNWWFEPWRKWNTYSSPMFDNTLIWSTSLVPTLKYLEYDYKPLLVRVVTPLSNYSSVALTKGVKFSVATKANGVDMEKSEGLVFARNEEGMATTLSESELVLAFDAASSSAAESPSDVNGPDESIRIRKDMNPTAFFVSNLRTDKNGRAKFSFTTPQLLTRWNFQGLAHTADLKSAFFKKQVTTRKQLMIQPRAPRFVRQGDTFIFSSKLMNVTEQDINATVRLEIIDPATSETLEMIDDTAVKKVKVKAGESTEVSFKINVPGNINMFEYRITAASAKHSDGQQELIPVLSSRSVVTESVTLFNNGRETRNFELKALSENLLSATATDCTLTLEYTPSPVWYAIQALPYMAKLDNPSNECLFHRYFANALTLHILTTRPAIRRMLDKWADIPADSWQTQLEKNEDLKQTLLKETPWVLDSRNEKESLRRLAEAFTQDRVETEQHAALKELIERQEPEGGWSWIPGYKPDFWVTNTIVSGIGQLVNLGCISLDSEPDLKNAVLSALHWLDKETKEYYSKTKLEDIKSVTERDLEWLLAHAILSDIGVASGCQEIYDCLQKTAATEDTHGLSLYTRASLTLLMAACGDANRAGELAATLVDRSIYDDEQGRWWRDNTGGYLWHQAPVETQSRIIQALLSVNGRTVEAAECGRWLLKQKQTTHWATSPATAQAVMALLRVGDIQGSLLDVPAVSYISIGDETIKAGGDDTDAGYTIRKWQEPGNPAMGKVSVRNGSPEIGWGALSIQYTDEMDKIRYSGNGISLKRTLYRVDENNNGTTLHQVADGEALNVGDRLRIRIELSCDRNLEYVQLKDMRAASFEPVSTRAGFSFNWHDDLRSYVVPESASQVFYIDRLSRGSYLVEYDVYAEQAGTFSSGIVSAQCMYAPEFRSTASSASVTVR